MTTKSTILNPNALSSDLDSFWSYNYWEMVVFDSTPALGVMTVMLPEVVVVVLLELEVELPDWDGMSLINDF